MNKELFVSSTPHETKVGMVEDDLLAEIYLERENEYTLAGSIYKGRVTRVLPGMQSAFVDIGLERDAFLYVSDFMELEDSDEVDELPTSPVVAEPRPQAEAASDTRRRLRFLRLGIGHRSASCNSVPARAEFGIRQWWRTRRAWWMARRPAPPARRTSR